MRLASLAISLSAAAIVVSASRGAAQNREPASAVTAHASDATALHLAADPLAAVLALARPRVDEERWRLIPWHTSLTAALREAAARQRPVFFFGYDGILDEGNC